MSFLFLILTLLGRISSEPAVLNMACLYRAVTMVRQTWKMSIVTHNKFTINRYSDILSRVYFLMGPFVFYYGAENKSNLIPTAEKYLLVGEETVVERIKHQIAVESTKKSLRNYWYKRREVDVEIIKNNTQYNKIEEENKNIRLILCISTETDYAKAELCLPETGILPSNIKSKNIIIEHLMGDELLRKNKQWLKTNPEIEKHFKGTELTTIAPCLTPVYNNVNMHDPTMIKITTAFYVVSQFLALIAILRRR